MARVDIAVFTQVTATISPEYCHSMSRIIITLFNSIQSQCGTTFRYVSNNVTDMAPSWIINGDWNSVCRAYKLLATATRMCQRELTEDAGTFIDSFSSDCQIVQQSGTLALDEYSSVIRIPERSSVMENPCEQGTGTEKVPGSQSWRYHQPVLESVLEDDYATPPHLSQIFSGVRMSESIPSHVGGAGNSACAVYSTDMLADSPSEGATYTGFASLTTEPYFMYGNSGVHNTPLWLPTFNSESMKYPDVVSSVYDSVTLMGTEAASCSSVHNSVSIPAAAATAAAEIEFADSPLNCSSAGFPHIDCQAVSSFGSYASCTSTTLAQGEGDYWAVAAATSVEQTDRPITMVEGVLADTTNSLLRNISQIYPWTYSANLPQSETKPAQTYNQVNSCFPSQVSLLQSLDTKCQETFYSHATSMDVSCPRNTNIENVESVSHLSNPLFPAMQPVNCRTELTQTAVYDSMSHHLNGRNLNSTTNNKNGDLNSTMSEVLYSTSLYPSAQTMTGFQSVSAVAKVFEISDRKISSLKPVGTDDYFKRLSHDVHLTEVTNVADNRIPLDSIITNKQQKLQVYGNQTGVIGTVPAQVELEGSPQLAHTPGYKGKDGNWSDMNKVKMLDFLMVDEQTRRGVQELNATSSTDGCSESDVWHLLRVRELVASQTISNDTTSMLPLGQINLPSHNTEVSTVRLQGEVMAESDSNNPVPHTFTTNIYPQNRTGVHNGSGDISSFSSTVRHFGYTEENSAATAEASAEATAEATAENVEENFWYPGHTADYQAPSTVRLHAALCGSQHGSVRWRGDDVESVMKRNGTDVESTSSDQNYSVREVSEISASDQCNYPTDRVPCKKYGRMVKSAVDERVMPNNSIERVSDPSCSQDLQQCLETMQVVSSTHAAAGQMVKKTKTTAKKLARKRQLDAKDSTRNIKCHSVVADVDSRRLVAECEDTAAGESVVTSRADVKAFKPRGKSSMKESQKDTSLKKTNRQAEVSRELENQRSNTSDELDFMGEFDDIMNESGRSGGADVTVGKPCAQCGQVFSSSSNLHRHVRVTHQRLRFECSDCNKSFTCKVSLQRHIRVTHDRLKCSVCGKIFDTHERLRSHRCVESIKARPSCATCKRSFSSMSNLNHHQRTAHSFSCVECVKIFNSKSDLRKHVTAFHCDKDLSGLENQNLIINRTGGPSNSSTSDELTNPLMQQESSREFSPVNRHGRKFLTRNHKLMQCKRSVVKSVSSAQRWRKMAVLCAGPVPCRNCGKKFSTLSNMLRHVRMVHDRMRYVCQECGVQYAGSHALKQHRDTAHQRKGDSGFRCSDCGAAYESMRRLCRHSWLAHRRLAVPPGTTRSTEGGSQCHQCGRTFLHRRNLLRHCRMLHSG